MFSPNGWIFYSCQMLNQTCAVRKVVTSLSFLLKIYLRVLIEWYKSYLYFFMRRIFLIVNQGCLFSSCFNGGFCLLDKEKQAFLCSCQPLWTGDRCEVRLGNNDILTLSLNSGKRGFKINLFLFWQVLLVPSASDAKYDRLL